MEKRKYSHEPHNTLRTIILKRKTKQKEEYNVYISEPNTSLVIINFSFHWPYFYTELVTFRFTCDAISRT